MGSAVTTTTYDARGRRAAQTDQAGVTTEFEHDAFGRLTAVVQPEVADAESSPGVAVRPRTEYEHDRYGNVVLIRDAKGREPRFTFDEHNRRLTRTLPMGQVETSQYDTLGRLSQHTDFNGQVTKVFYDGQGRPDRTEYFAVGAATPTDTVTYVYDAEGRRDTVADTRHGTTERVFDREGRLTRVTTPEGTVRYAYDALGRKTRTWTDRTDLRSTYDTLGRLRTVAAHELDDAEVGTPALGTRARRPAGAPPAHP